MSDQKDNQQKLEQNPEKKNDSQSKSQLSDPVFLSSQQVLQNPDEQSLEEKKKQIDELQSELNEESSNYQYLQQLIIDKYDQDDADERSVFVKNVDYSADPKELKEHFQECGEIKRITIPVDKFSNQPKGFAYVEFATAEGAMKAKRLNESLFKGRQITVIPKRKNVPGKGRGTRGGKNPLMQIAGMLQMAMMGRGRGRGRGGFKPY